MYSPPTLGSCHGWLERGGVPKADRIIQECGAGLVPIRRDGTRLAFAAPPLIRGGDASIAQWLIAAGHVRAPYTARQGTVLGRSGRVYIDESDGEIWVGGDVTTCVSRSVTF